MFRRGIMVIVAMGFGLGRSPIAPGTVGTLLGIALAALTVPLTWPWQALVAAVLTVLAIPVCDAAEEHFGHKDDHRIVADEFMTFPICVIGLPWVEHPWLLGVAFVVNRVLDIVKPPPAYQAQSLRGGLGIVCDDAITSLYTLAINHALFWGVTRYLARG